MKITSKPVQDKSLEKSLDVKNTKNTKVNSANKKINSNRDINSSAKLTLSAKAKEFQKIKDAVKNTPEVDKAKVDRIKKALKAGKFSVNYDKLAEKIVEHDIMYDLLS